MRCNVSLCYYNPEQGIKFDGQCWKQLALCTPPVRLLCVCERCFQQACENTPIWEQSESCGVSKASKSSKTSLPSKLCDLSPLQCEAAVPSQEQNTLNIWTRISVCVCTRVCVLWACYIISVGGWKQAHYTCEVWQLCMLFMQYVNDRSPWAVFNKGSSFSYRNHWNHNLLHSNISRYIAQDTIIYLVIVLSSFCLSLTDLKTGMFCLFWNMR